MINLYALDFKSTQYCQGFFHLNKFTGIYIWRNSRRAREYLFFDFLQKCEHNCVVSNNDFLIDLIKLFFILLFWMKILIFSEKITTNLIEIFALKNPIVNKQNIYIKYFFMKTWIPFFAFIQLQNIVKIKRFLTILCQKKDKSLFLIS